MSNKTTISQIDGKTHYWCFSCNTWVVEEKMDFRNKQSNTATMCVLCRNIYNNRRYQEKYSAEARAKNGTNDLYNQRLKARREKREQKKKDLAFKNVDTSYLTIKGYSQEDVEETMNVMDRMGFDITKPIHPQFLALLKLKYGVYLDE